MLLKGTPWTSVALSVGGLVACIFLTGCPKTPKIVRKLPGASGESKLQVRVNVSPAANKNNPVAVDLVLVKNKKLLQELMKMSASEWFEKRQQVRLDYPKEEGLDAGSWEWVPGQVVKLDTMVVQVDVVGGVVFANYFTTGAHRASVDPRKNFLLSLGEENFTVQTATK